MNDYVLKYKPIDRSKNNILDKYKKTVTSQHGEDGIIEHIIKILGNNISKWCVEFGAFDGVQLSNTYNLIYNYLWNGVLIEGSKKRYKSLEDNCADNDRSFLINGMVGFDSNNNLDSFLAKTPIPRKFGLLSIDIDGCDYYIWESITKYTPTIVIIEFNPTIPNDIIFIQKKDILVNQGNSLLALIELGKEKGYELISVIGCNGIFILKEHYNKFNIIDNSIQYMNNDSGKRIWNGYDGTIYTSNFNRLGWKKLDVPFEALQIIPKDKRMQYLNSTKG